MKKESLIVLCSYHHNNTEKVAKAIAEVLDAQIINPQQVDTKEIKEYRLIGFGSGIYDGKHHKSLLNFVDKIPEANNQKVFIFSTCGMPRIFINNDVIKKNHEIIKEKLQAKGYTIIGEFGCAGLNTNGFLKLFGGMNKGLPNNKDIERAKNFAQTLK